CIPGALADAVDGALDLAGSGGDSGQGIGDRHAQVIVTMGGDGDAVDALDAAADHRDQFAEFRGYGVADGVGDVESGCADFDYGVEDPAEEIGIGAGGVFGREFDVIAKRFCQTNGFAGLRDALLTGDAQLVLQVDVGGCEEHVNAGTGSMLQ